MSENYQETTDYIKNNLRFSEVLYVLTSDKDAETLAQEYKGKDSEELETHIEKLREMYHDEEVDIAESFDLDW